MDHAEKHPWARRFSVFWQYRTLLIELVRRDIKVKYRKSVLGILWSVLHPLGTMTIMTIVFSSLFRFQIPHYPVYVLVGNIVFGFFSGATGIATNAVLHNAALIKKIYIPKYLFPAATVCSSMVNFLFSLVALLLVMLVFSVPFHATMLLLFVPFAALFLFTLGMSLILSALNVYFRDTQYLYGVLLTAWMYLTPIFYPADIIPARFRWLLDMNPLANCLAFFRALILGGELPEMRIICFAFGAGATALFLGIIVFLRLQRRFILYI